MKHDAARSSARSTRRGQPAPPSPSTTLCCRRWPQQARRPGVFLRRRPRPERHRTGAPLPQFARLNRRDLVFVDQRGTGRSAPLRCDDEPTLRPLADSRTRPGGGLRSRCRVRWRRCRMATCATSPRTPWPISTRCVRHSARRASTWWPRRTARAQRSSTCACFRSAVRRVVLDGVAPADMALPASFSTDNQAALDGLFDWCAADADCRARHPALRQQWLACSSRCRARSR